jgi:glycosyltransferase involved in cell wall biosynthesis
MRLLVIVNKVLPPSDYRLAHARLSRVCNDMVFGLPDAPVDLEPGHYVRMGFAESISVADAGHFVSLFRYLRRERKHLSAVHFYSTKLTLLGPLIARLAGVPSLVTVAGFGRVFNSNAPRYRVLRPLYLLLARLATALARAVLFQNRGDLRFFIERLPSTKTKCRYVGSGVDANLFTQRTFRAPRLRVVMVGRLLPTKGIDDFLAIARALPKDSFELVLIGPASRGQEELHARVVEAAARGTIRYEGELPAADTERELTRADVLLFTSHGEGMSRVMLEAGFAGACPVGYTIAANQDLVAPGRGFLVPRGDITAAVSILRRLGDDRALLTKNALAYQAFVQTQFSSEAFAARLDVILTEVLGAEPSGARHAG